MKKIIFLTGVTGNIGARILLDLLYNDSVVKIILLVRGKTNSDAEGRVKETMHKISPDLVWDKVLEKITVFNGDITKFRMGLNSQQYHYLKNNTNYIIHSAAATNFDNTLTDALKVNLYGTINIMKLAEDAYKEGQLLRFGYVSTAYVNGRMKNTIYEDKLQENPHFDNTYEQSKYEAEKYVRSKMHKLPVCIFRPSIVVGDSETGRLVKYNVLYTPLKMICSGLFDIIPCSPQTCLNVVPVDYITSAIQKIIFSSDEVNGKTFNLVSNNNQTMTVREILEYAIEYKLIDGQLEKRAKVKYIPHQLLDLITPILPHKFKRLKKIIDMYIPYIRRTSIFDNTNTRTFMNNSTIKPPVLRKFLPTLFKTCFARQKLQSLSSAA